MGSRLARKNKERENARQERKTKVRRTFTDRIEEFRLNREGKTKRKRSDVHSKHRRIDRILSLMILIVFLLFVIVWVYILFI